MSFNFFSGCHVLLFKSIWVSKIDYSDPYFLGKFPKSRLPIPGTHTYICKLPCKMFTPILTSTHQRLLLIAFITDNDPVPGTGLFDPLARE